MSANAVIGTLAARRDDATVATGDISLVAGDEVRLVPATRVVIVTPALPIASPGISAEWTTSIASRAEGMSHEHAEIRCVVDLTALVTEYRGGLDRVAGVYEELASLGKISAAQFGTILGGEMLCLEMPGPTATDLDLWANVAPLAEFERASTTGTKIVDASIWSLGKRVSFSAIPEPNTYLHIAQGTSFGGGIVFTSGKFLITFYCRYAL